MCVNKLGVLQRPQCYRGRSITEAGSVTEAGVLCNIPSYSIGSRIGGKGAKPSDFAVAL